MFVRFFFFKCSDTERRAIALVDAERYHGFIEASRPTNVMSVPWRVVTTGISQLCVFKICFAMRTPLPAHGIQPGSTCSKSNPLMLNHRSPSCWPAPTRGRIFKRIRTDINFVIKRFDSEVKATRLWIRDEVDLMTSLRQRHVQLGRYHATAPKRG